VTLPMELRQESLRGDNSVVAALYGPLVLAADLGAGPVDGAMRVVHGRPTEPEHLPAPDPLPKVTPARDGNAPQWVQIESASELRFTAGSDNAKYQVSPMHAIGEQRYSVYWKMQS
jgi:uncharacterized protein